MGPDEREALPDKLVPPRGVIWPPFGMACGMLTMPGEQGINEVQRSVEKGDYLPVLEVARVSVQPVDPIAKVLVMLCLCQMVSGSRHCCLLRFLPYPNEVLADSLRYENGFLISLFDDQELSLKLRIQFIQFSFLSIYLFTDVDVKVVNDGNDAKCLAECDNPNGTDLAYLGKGLHEAATNPCWGWMLLVHLLQYPYSVLVSSHWPHSLR